jgi:hypothetical protein
MLLVCEQTPAPDVFTRSPSTPHCNRKCPHYSDCCFLFIQHQFTLPIINYWHHHDCRSHLFHVLINMQISVNDTVHLYDQHWCKQVVYLNWAYISTNIVLFSSQHHQIHQIIPMSICGRRIISNDVDVYIFHRYKQVNENYQLLFVALLSIKMNNRIVLKGRIVDGKHNGQLASNC